jgi:hypothetical protein
MKKPKRKLTSKERKEKARRKAEFMTIFINGKQKRVRRPVLVEGMDPDEFIRRNADPIWLHQNEMWEYMDLGLSGEGTGSDDDDPDCSRK